MKLRLCPLDPGGKDPADGGPPQGGGSLWSLLSLGPHSVGRRLPRSHSDSNREMGKLRGLAGIPTSFLENTMVLIEDPGELTGGADFPPNLLCDPGQFLQPL